MKILDFYKFIYERQRVWYNKEHLKKPRPWTKDHRLHTFKFCNVYRELDKGTVHLIDNVINKKIPLEDKIFNVLIYRRFNTPYFFDQYGIISWNPFPVKSLEKIMRRDKSKGIKLFNDAYMITCPSFHGKLIREKHKLQLAIFKEVVPLIPSITKAIKKSKNLQSVHTLLRNSVFGTGDFIGYQYVTDITYFPEFKNKWDLNSFVALGPGSKPGVRLLFPKAKEKELLKWCYFLHEMQATFFRELKEKTGKNWLKIRYKTPYYDSKYLSLSNIQNCLCEFRKYIMLDLDPDKRKRYYKKGAK